MKPEMEMIDSGKESLVRSNSAQREEAAIQPEGTTSSNVTIFETNRSLVLWNSDRKDILRFQDERERYRGVFKEGFEIKDTMQKWIIFYK